MITGVLANVAVSDLQAAERWYAQLFGSAPDQRPMDGLIEWSVNHTATVQVFADQDRAAKSSVTLADTDLDATADRLAAAGVSHDGPQPGGGARILQLLDPDGNRVVLIGS